MNRIKIMALLCLASPLYMMGAAQKINTGESSPLVISKKSVEFLRETSIPLCRALGVYIGEDPLKHNNAIEISSDCFFGHYNSNHPLTAKGTSLNKNQKARLRQKRIQTATGSFSLLRGLFAALDAHLRTRSTKNARDVVETIKAHLNNDKTIRFTLESPVAQMATLDNNSAPALSPLQKSPESKTNDVQALNVSADVWNVWRKDPTFELNPLFEHKEHIDSHFKYKPGTSLYIPKNEIITRKITRLAMHVPLEEAQLTAEYLWNGLVHEAEATRSMIRQKQRAKTPVDALNTPSDAQLAPQIAELAASLSPNDAPGVANISSVKLSEELWSHLQTSEKEYIIKHFFTPLWGSAPNTQARFLEVDRRITDGFKKYPITAVTKKEFLDRGLTFKQYSQESLEKSWNNAAHLLEEAQEELTALKTGHKIVITKGLWIYLFEDEKAFLINNLFRLLWKPSDDLRYDKLTADVWFSTHPSVKITEKDFNRIAVTNGYKVEDLSQSWQQISNFFKGARANLAQTKKEAAESPLSLSPTTFNHVKKNPEFTAIAHSKTIQNIQNTFEKAPEGSMQMTIKENPKIETLKLIRLIKQARKDIRYPESIVLPGTAWHYLNTHKKLNLLTQHFDANAQNYLNGLFCKDKGAVVNVDKKTFIDDYNSSHPNPDFFQQKKDASRAWASFTTTVAAALEEAAVSNFAQDEQSDSAEHSSDIDESDEEGKTELIRAVLKGNHQKVHELLERNANPDVADGKGKTARDYAKLSRNRIIKRLLNPITANNVLQAASIPEHQVNTPSLDEGKKEPVVVKTSTLSHDERELQTWRLYRQMLNSNERCSLSADDLSLLYKRKEQLNQQELRLLNGLLDQRPAVRRHKPATAAMFNIYTPAETAHNKPRKQAHQNTNKNKANHKKQQPPHATQAAVTVPTVPHKAVELLPTYSQHERAAMNETHALIAAAVAAKMNKHQLHDIPSARDEVGSPRGQNEQERAEEGKESQQVKLPRQLLLGGDNTHLLLAKVIRDHHLCPEQESMKDSAGLVSQKQYNGCYRLGSKTMFPSIPLDTLVAQVAQGFDNDIVRFQEKQMEDGTYREIFETTITNPDIRDIQYNQIPVRFVVAKDGPSRKIISVYPVIRKGKHPRTHAERAE